MATVEVQPDSYANLFEAPQDKSAYFLTKWIMIIYYIAFNALLICMALDSYYEFMQKSEWFIGSLILIVLNNFCQFLRYVCIYG